VSHRTVPRLKYARLNKCVLSTVFSVAKMFDWRMHLSGKLFQTAGPDTEKARRTMSKHWSTDRRLRFGEYGVTRSWMYSGASSCKAENTSITIIYSGRASDPEDYLPTGNPFTC